MDVTSTVYSLAIAIYKPSVGIVSFIGQHQDKGPHHQHLRHRYYIHSVLETGDHDPYRIIKFEISDSNDIIEFHSKISVRICFVHYRANDPHESFLKLAICIVAYIMSCMRCACTSKLPYIRISKTFRSNALSRSQRTSKNWWM